MVTGQLDIVDLEKRRVLEERRSFVDPRGSKRHDTTCEIAVGSEAGNSIKGVTLRISYQKLQDIMFPSRFHPSKSYQPILLLYPVILLHFYSVGPTKNHLTELSLRFHKSKACIQKKIKTSIVWIYKFVLEASADFL